MSVCFDARRAEKMTTGEYMLWSFKETAPADTAILKVMASVTFSGL
jgi:hypothetical protein